MEWFSTIKQGLMELASQPFSAEKRVFLGYLFTAIALAYWVYRRQNNKQGFLAFLLPRSIYLNHSAIVDYQMLLINKFLKMLLIVPFVLTMPTVFLYFTGGLEAAFGQPLAISISPWLLTSLFTLCLFIADDLTRFLLHAALHKIPVLWQFHQVHHSAEVLTPLTIYRSHPVENLLYAVRMAFTQGLVIAVFYYYFGEQLDVYDVLGANLFTFLFNCAGSNLRHSHIWLRWGRLEHIFISPAQHQIHHSVAPEHHDKNYGTCLALWDKLAGSLVLAPKKPIEAWGLGDELHQANMRSLMAQYWQPFVGVFKLSQARLKSAVKHFPFKRRQAES